MIGGLISMGFFTICWALTVSTGLYGVWKIAILITFCSIGLFFIVYAIRIHVSRKGGMGYALAVLHTSSKRRAQFWLAVGIEIGAIVLAIRALAIMNLNAYIVPAVALIVGLHFIPMAKVFNGTFEYYIAIWMCGVALIGIVMIFLFFPVALVSVVVGLGSALATTAYGIHVIRLNKTYFTQQQ